MISEHKKRCLTSLASGILNQNHSQVSFISYDHNKIRETAGVREDVNKGNMRIPLIHGWNCAVILEDSFVVS